MKRFKNGFQIKQSSCSLRYFDIPDILLLKYSVRRLYQYNEDDF